MADRIRNNDCLIKCLVEPEGDGMDCIDELKSPRVTSPSFSTSTLILYHDRLVAVCVTILELCVPAWAMTTMTRRKPA